MSTRNQKNQENNSSSTDHSSDEGLDPASCARYRLSGNTRQVNATSGQNNDVQFNSQRATSGQNNDVQVNSQRATSDKNNNFSVTSQRTSQRQNIHAPSQSNIPWYPRQLSPDNYFRNYESLSTVSHLKLFGFKMNRSSNPYPNY